MGVVPHRPFWLVFPQGHVLEIQKTLIINLQVCKSVNVRTKPNLEKFSVLKFYNAKNFLSFCFDKFLVEVWFKKREIIVNHGDWGVPCSHLTEKKAYF